MFNCNAKINLFLNVTGKYKSGYHSLKSIFAEIDLCDTLVYTRNNVDTFRIISDNSNIPQDDNIIIKAANTLCKTVQPAFCVDFTINKNIPLGGGLGGGSSNAACVLKLLNCLYHAQLSNNQLKIIGKNIGADVPFFIDGGLKKVFGIGEIVKPIPTHHPIMLLHIVLVFPKARVSTVLAYNKMDEMNICGETYFEKKKFKNIIKGLSTNNYELVVNNIYNKFEQVVYPIDNEFDVIKSAIIDSGADVAFMSGSGSTMVGIYRSQDLCDKGLDYLSRSGFNSKQVYIQY